MVNVIFNKLDVPTFWDPLTGSTFKTLHSLGCLFSDSKFYANISSFEFPSQFKLSDTSLWKELTLPTLTSITRVPNINPNPLESCKSKLESDITSDLIQYIQVHRSNHALSTIIDEELSWVQRQSLWNHELTKLVEFKDSNFEPCILSLLSPGTIYRGYPCNFNHVNSVKIFSILSKNKTCRSVLLSNGDGVRLGVCCRIFFYGESSLSVWILVSAIYK